MQTLLTQYETKLSLSPRQAAQTLGVCYSNYMAMKAGTRPTPKYVSWHAEALLAVEPSAAARITKRRLKNG